MSFFKVAIEKIKAQGTPSLIQENVGKTVPIKDIRQAYGGDAFVVLKCDGNRLSQVFTCYNKTADHVPANLRQCAPHVLKEDTCKEDSVLIPTFHATL